MASLFNTLLQLQNRHTDRTPLEDYFTELFAYLLQDSPDILAAFLVRFQLSQLSGQLVANVATQISYERLEGHPMDSRPDLVLQIESFGVQGLIFIESKVGSKEGLDQLQRYAEHLAAQSSVEERVLVYVTRDHDPKDAVEILVKVPAHCIRFVQLRWYDVYSFLKKSFSNHWLAREVCRFMEKNRMSQNLQFNPIDLLALTNFRQAKSMMDQSLDGEVLTRLKRFGGTGSKLTNAIKQFDSNARYIIYADQLNGLWVGLGYFMPDEDTFSYPRVGLIMEVNTHAPGDAKIVIEAMKSILRDNPKEWEGENVNLMRHWVSIRRMQPLHDFLKGDDHQKQVKDFLLDCMQAIEDIKVSYPKLPWSRVPTSVISESDVILELSPVPTHQSEEEIA